jgi:sodium-dependent dicarboxylate transporter 2/3/5
LRSYRVAARARADSAAARALAERLPEGPAALLAAALLFVIPTDWKNRRFALDWPTAAKIDWGTVMLFGGGMSLGGMMFSSGLAGKIGDGLVGLNSSGTLAGFVAVSTAAAILVSEATSNTASVSMVVPVVIAVAKSRGLDPVLPALAATLGSSFGFALPVSTAPNALAYGTGLVPITRMLRAGLLLDLLGWLTICGMMLLLRP